MANSSQDTSQPRHAQVDAILDRDGNPIFSDSGKAQGPEAGPRAWASHIRVLSTAGLPWPAKLALGVLIPALLLLGLAIILFFLAGLLVFRTVGGVLGLLGFASPRRPHRDPMDLIRSR